MKRVIVVCSTAGRCGTSLTIGLLKKSGFDVGKIGTITDENNAKGYYEILPLQEWIFDTCRLNGYKIEPANIERKIDLAIKSQKAFSKELDKYFTGNEIAIKIPYFIPLYLFSPDIEIIVVSLQRNHKEQGLSIKKMNNGVGEFTEWLDTWQKTIDKHFRSDITIDFSEWIGNPYQTYLRLCEVVKPPQIITETEVMSFIDPKLKHF